MNKYMIMRFAQCEEIIHAADTTELDKILILKHGAYWRWRFEVFILTKIEF